ncbi:XdhC family protein [Panacibacter ginsenosidivorans]|uniref:XdhC family protein n=1 Tax=Panacibacter ginsenosidivorans TaxID=1813871 RepID=A0A5B8V8K9_9BACT|nr:XdhC family protein [Panacibacter ginsenosidivorans]QEC67171.1 XdhC family protein [Panacibacter ginsenosidivorans]
MKEIKAIIDAYKGIDFATTKAALATVARVEGSSYRRSGARMLVLDNGNYLGGISGGCLEGDALRRSQKAIVQDKPSIITYDTTQDDGAQIGVGLGCNGIIDVLFTPLHKEDKNNPVELLSALTEIRKPKAVVSITSGTQKDVLGKTIVYETREQFSKDFPLANITAAVEEEIHQCLNKQASVTVNYNEESVRVFIEVLFPVTHLILYGGNYDIYPMARCARELGWDVTVVMNIQKANKALFSIGAKVINNKSEENPLIDAYSAVVLMAHDYKTDLQNLQKVLATNTRYIGMLGPRKRSRKMFDVMANEGNSLNEENMQRIFAPAGLDIGAATPEEIALSICAEIRSVFAKRNGTSLRLREGTIYGNS